MKPQKGIMRYSYAEDILVVRPEKRSYDSSVHIGNFIIDVDKNGIVNGIEILDASKIMNVPKSTLRSVVSWNVEVESSPEYIRFKLLIKAQVRNAERVSNLIMEKLCPEGVEPSLMSMAASA